MRSRIFLSALIGFLTAAPVFAQSYTAVILQKEVEVRSGPGKDKFYPTSKLYQNDKVLVLRESKEAPGWLEIMPPPGSFSWIDAKYVKFRQQGDRLGAVDPDMVQPVALLPGSVVVNQEPNRESIKVIPGTIVELVERPMTVGQATWLPIKPHPNEVRYIPAEAVKGAVVIAPTTVSGRPWAVTPSNWALDPAVAAADKELFAGNKEQARQLYWQAINSPTLDQPNKTYARTRYDSLTNPTVPATTTSLSPANAPPPPTAANLQTLRGPDWTTYGRVAETKLLSDNGQPLYALDDGRGGLPIYVTTAPGKSLQGYLGKWITVYGPTMYRPDVRIQYVVASHVAVP